MAYSLDNKTNENLNHRNVESNWICETHIQLRIPPRSIARPHVLSPFVTWRSSGFRPQQPLFWYRAITRRFHAERFPGRHSQHTARRGFGNSDGDGTRSNLAAVGSLPPREVTRSRFLFSSRTVIFWTGRNRACQSGYRE